MIADWLAGTGLPQGRNRVGMFSFGRNRDFESLVRPEIPVLFRVARRMVTSPEDAEDLVSLTMIRAHQAWGRFDGQHLRSWLVRILRNEFLKMLRSKKETASLEEIEFDPADDAAITWKEVADRMTVEAILEEMEALSTDHLLILQLCDGEEMSYEEVAKVLEVPLGTVRSRLFRARVALRKRLAERLGGEVLP